MNERTGQTSVLAAIGNAEYNRRVNPPPDAEPDATDWMALGEWVMEETVLQFDAELHRYTLAGVEVPSVTKILRAVLPVRYHGATDWHMDRGTAVHACAALECRGVEYTHDPQIAGYVAAIRGWMETRRPSILLVEHRVHRTAPIPYAGTLDLLCIISRVPFLCDWKSTSSPWDQWQLGAYFDALDDNGIQARMGMTIELHEDGTWKESKPINLHRARMEWRSILNVYAMMKREGIKVQE